MKGKGGSLTEESKGRMSEWRKDQEVYSEAKTTEPHQRTPELSDGRKPVAMQEELSEAMRPMGMTPGV